MSGKKGAGRQAAYDKAAAKHEEAIGIQQEHRETVQMLLDLQESLNMIFAPMANLTDEINAEMQMMMENKALLEYGAQMSTETLNDLTAAYNITAEKQEVHLQAQQDEIAKAEAELAVVQEEVASAEAILRQKEQQIADMQTEIAEETELYEQQMKTLMELELKSAKSPAKRLQFLEDQKAFLAESARLDEMINMQQAENDQMRKTNAAMKEELNALEEQNRLKRANVAKLEATLIASKKMHSRLEKRNLKLSGKVSAGEQQQQEEIVRLEQQLRECRVVYDNAKRADAEMSAKLNAAIGDGGSFEEVMVQYEHDADALNVECRELEQKIKAARETKLAKEKELKELEEQKNQIVRAVVENASASAAHVPTGPTEFKQPEVAQHQQQQQQMTRPQNRSDDPPPNGRKKRGKKSKDRHRAQPLPQVRNVPNVQNADSSVTDSWPSSSAFRAQFDSTEAARHLHSMELYKKFDM